MQVFSDTFSISVVVTVLVVIRQMEAVYVSGCNECYPGESSFHGLPPVAVWWPTARQLPVM